MARRRSTNFDITIREAPTNAGTGRYTLTATYRERTADGTCRLDPNHPAWQQTLLALNDPSRPPGRRALVDVGARLFHSIMAEEVRDLWVWARTDLDAGTVAGVRLRLALQPPAIGCLPWELLYDDQRNELLAGSTHTSLVRVEQVFRHVGSSRPLRTELPVSILLVAPEDPSGQIDAGRELGDIARPLAGLGTTHVQVHSLTGRFNVVELRKRMEQIQPDVLHYIGHGLPDGLLLWHREQPTLVAPGALRTVVQQVPSLKLIFLNACLAGRLSPDQPFATVGPQLLQAGIPAVIAMQFEIADQVANDLAVYVYEELLTGSTPGAIDAAVRHARSNLYALAPDEIGYATPVLWLNVADGVIFDVPERASAVATLPRERTRVPDAARVPAAAERPTLPPQPPERLAALRAEAASIQAWLEALETMDGKGVDAELRVLLAQRRREIHTLRHLFTQLHHLARTHQAAPDQARSLHAYGAKLDEIRRKQRAIQRLDAHIPPSGCTT